MPKMLFSYIITLLAWSLAVNAQPEARPQCGPKIVSLATGIRMNIVGQMAELNATESLLRLENSPPFKTTTFAIRKGKLLADIAAGINIRNYNLGIAPPKNPAVPGLHEYARKQGPEQKIAQELTGNPKHDVPQLKTLKMDIMGGIKLNMHNLALSTSKNNCDLGFTFPPFP